MRKFFRASNTEGSHPHYVYDMSLPMPERKLQRLFFTTGTAAANWLGVVPQRVYMNRKSKCRIWSDLRGGWFAVRIATLENELT